MPKLFCRKHILFFRKATSAVLVFCFSVFSVVGPAASQMIPTSVFGLTSNFQPPVLRGMTVHAENPLLFDFIVDRGQDKIGNELLKDESTKLIKYFLTSMTIPDKDAWVNLSPTEKDRIIPDALGQTEMGRQMLEQDYVLKQLAASLTNPDTELGKKFWDTVNERSLAAGNRHACSLQNKVWIVPDGATVVEKDGFAYITESKLTVMLDEEYVDGPSKNISPPRGGGGNKEGQSLSTAVFREMILPKLVEEVNSGKNFAATRQVYQSVILAAWYKRALKDSLLGKIYADKSKIAGVETDVKDIKEKVYEQYLEAFKKGAYNVIKEEAGPDGDMIPRKYFSGGENWDMSGSSSLTVLYDSGHQRAGIAIKEFPKDQLALIPVRGVETGTEEANAVAGSVVTQNSKSVLAPSGLTIEYKDVSKIGIDQDFLVSIIEKIIDLETSGGLKLESIDGIVVERLDGGSSDKRSYLLSVGEKKYVVKRQSRYSSYVGYLENEGEILRILNEQPTNPHIAELLLENIGSTNTDSDSRKYLVVNYLPGQSLSDRIKTQGVLNLGESVDFAVKLAEVVKFIHDHGVIHGDLTPGNIVLDFDGVSVMDFDISHRKDYDWKLDPAELLSDVITLRQDFNERGASVFGRRTDVQLDISYIGQSIYAGVTGRSLTGVSEVNNIKNESLREIVLRTVASRTDLSEKGRYKTVDELLKDLQVLKKTLNLEDPSTLASSSVDVKLRDEALIILQKYRNQRPNDRSIIDGQQGTWDELKVKIESGEIIPDDDKQSLRYNDTMRKSFLPDFWYHGTGNNSNFAWDILFGKNPGYLINVQSITNRRTHLTQDKNFAENYASYSQGFLLTFDFSGDRRLDALKYFSAMEVFSRESVGIEKPLPINLLTRNSKFDILAQFDTMKEDQMETAANFLGLPLQDVKNFYQNGKRDSQSASSSISQNLVMALVAAGVLCSGGCSTIQRHELNQQLEQVVEGKESQFLTVRGPLLAALALYNSSTASAEFKASIKQNIHVLFKQAGYGLVPVYNEFDPAKPVVLFIHGASGEGGAAKFVDALALYHGANLLAYQFDVSKPLEEIAKELGAKWKDFIRENGVRQNQVIVVAHSYGSIVLRQSVLKDPNLYKNAAGVVEVAPTLGGSRFALGYGGAISETITSIFGFEAISKAQNPNGLIQEALNTPQAIEFFNGLKGTVYLVEGDPHSPKKPEGEMSPAEIKFGENFRKALEGLDVIRLKGFSHGNAPSAPEVLEGLGKLIKAASSASSTVAVVKGAPALALKNESTVGGIDFDPSKLNLQIKRDGKGVPLPLPQQDLENINIQGLYPVILNILPVNAQTLPILGQLNGQPDAALSRG